MQRRVGAVDCNAVQSRVRKALVYLLLACGIVWGVVRRQPAGGRFGAERDALRVMTWNLRNFPGDHDHAWMRRQIAAMGPDVVAFQEVLDPAAVRDLVPGFDLLVSQGGGRNAQHLAVAYDPALLRPAAPAHDENVMSLGGEVRPAFIAPLRTHEGRAFEIVVVHLKATARGYPIRQTQWQLLRQVLLTRDRPLVVLGDFNAAGGSDIPPEHERAALDATLDAAGMVRLPAEHGCTAYWHGRRYDAWLEPSELDLIYVSRVWVQHLDPVPSSRSGSHCKVHHCGPFRSSEAYPEASYMRASDHCPMLVALPWPSS